MGARARAASRGAARRPQPAGAPVVGTWAAAMNGETDDTVRAAVEHELAYNHSAYYLTRNATPAPTLIANGFTDDLFSAMEGIRYANSHPQATLAQMYFDFGHTRGQ